MLQTRVLRHVARSSQSGASKSRQYSNLPLSRIRSSPATNSLSFRPQMSRSSRYTTPLVASLVTSGGIRFQSTQPDKTAQLFEQIPDISPAAQGSGSIIRNATSDVFEKLSDSVQNTGTEIVPHIGMLKEAGLDFGWGFTSMAQWIIEHIHVWADMPWWAALASTALLYRTVFLWPMYHSSHNAAIGQAIAPAQREIKDRYKNMDLDNNQRMALMQQEMRYLSKKTGYSIAGHIGPIVAQGLFTFGIFRFTRNLATIPDLGLSDGGFLWLSNLHHADPYYILPVATGMTMYVMARSNFLRMKDSGSSMMADDSWLARFMLYGLPAITVAFLSGLPGATQIPISILSLTTAGTQTAFQQPWLRKKLNMAMFPKGVRTVVDVKGRPKAGQAAAAPKSTREVFEGMAETLGIGGNNNAKASSIEKARGKDVLASVKQYDEKRRKRLREQAMRDKF